MKTSLQLMLFAVLAGLAGSLSAQHPRHPTPPGQVLAHGGECGVFYPEGPFAEVARLEWKGGCVDGLASGQGVLRTYDGNDRLTSILKSTYDLGELTASSGYAVSDDGEAIVRHPADRTTGKPEPIRPEEVEPWARDILASISEQAISVNCLKELEGRAEWTVKNQCRHPVEITYCWEVESRPGWIHTDNTCANGRIIPSPRIAPGAEYVFERQPRSSDGRESAGQKIISAVRYLQTVTGNQVLQAAPPPGRVWVSAGSCQVAVHEQAYRNNPAGKRDWSGSCAQGLANGVGIYRIYNAAGQLTYIARMEFDQGGAAYFLETYFQDSSGRLRTREPGKADAASSRTWYVSSSQVPSWAREIAAGLSAPAVSAPIASAPRPQAVDPVNAGRDEAEGDEDEDEDEDEGSEISGTASAMAYLLGQMVGDRIAGHRQGNAGRQPAPQTQPLVPPVQSWRPGRMPSREQTTAVAPQRRDHSRAPATQCLAVRQGQRNYGSAVSQASGT